MSDTQRILQEVEQEFNENRILLIEEMERLQLTLSRSIKKLKTHKTTTSQPNLTINDWGEIQGLGSKIDVLCAKIMQANQISKKVRQITKKEKRNYKVKFQLPNGAITTSQEIVEATSEYEAFCIVRDKRPGLIVWVEDQKSGKSI